MENTKFDISVVIPTYNEAGRKDAMKNHLESIKKYFNNIDKSYEIIIVLDGPTDGTNQLVKQYQKEDENIRLIKRNINKGKGYSLREGLLSAKGIV